MDTTASSIDGTAARDTARETARGTNRPSWRDRAWWNRPRTVVVTAVVAGALVFLVGTLAGVDPQVRSGSGTLEVTIGMVVATSLTVALAGWGVRALLLRRRSGGRGAWLTLGGAVLLVSLLGPLGAANAGAMLLLVVEHLVVGGVILLGLSGAGRRAATAG